MASIQVEIRKPSFKTPPDFSFPPKYTHSNPTISEVVANTPTPVLPPDVRFPSYPAIPIVRNPSPGPTQLPEIMTPITPLSPPSKGPTLLTIPLELRLQIWNYVLLSHPIHHAHLSPILNDPQRKEEFHTSMLKPQGLSFPTSSSSHLLTSTSPSSPSHETATQIRHTRPPRIQGKIPTSLLLTNRQIYTETHLLPFTASHFAFVNWFWSGVYAARQFSRSLRPWQSESMRYVSVEVLGRDLWVGGMARLGGGIGGGATTTGGYGGKEGKGVGEWRELCSLWEGVRGLRLGVKGSVVLDPQTAPQNQGWNGEDGKWTSLDQTQLDQENRKHKERGILNVQLEWVIDGLLRMKSLRWIELEIEDEDVEREVKLEFCNELKSGLSQLRNRDDGWMDDVKVVFVERVTEKEVKFYYGEPGDDEVWNEP